MLRTAALLAVVLLGSSAPAESDFDSARAKVVVRQIAGFGPRPAGSVAERSAAGVVASAFSRAGYRVARQAVLLPRGGRSSNVIALPHGPIQAVVTAHLDGVRESSAANDNASGVAILVELARVVGPERGVLLAALGAEERVETGSDIHLGSARLVRGFSAGGKRRIRVAINLDMVGVGTRLHVRGIEDSPNRSARLVLAAARRASLRVTYLRDPGWSDHAELSRAGIPTAWIQWRDDSCWHEACDVPERVSTARLAAAGRLALETLNATVPGR